MKRPFAKAATLSALAAAAVLTACGSDTGTPVTPVTPTPSALKVTGTAAVGAPMANAAIQVTCAAGSATATANANGVYTVSITDGTLPCVLTATSADLLTALHSIAAGTGTADTTSNITPLSELLVAQLSGTDPKTFVDGFTATTAISAADVTTAQTSLLLTLTAAGIDTTNVSDIVGGALSAGSGTGYDGVLDHLGSAISAAGTTLAELTTAVSTTSASGGDTSSATLGTVLAPAASDCAGLKSGTLRVLDFAGGENFLIQIDAVALTAKSADGTYSLTRNATCDYTINDGSATRALVSRSGLVVLLTGTGADGAAGLAIPEQKLDVAALAGQYTRVQYGPEFDSSVGDFGDTEFSASGQNGVSNNCPQGHGHCVVDSSSKGALVANAEGGFDYMEGGVSQDRVFAFRNSTGRNLLVAQAPDGTVTLLAAKETAALPEVGRVSAYWQFQINNSGLGAVTEDSNTVTAVDTSAGKVTRQFASDSHTDTLSYNAPFTGMRYREANGCASSTGGAYTCSGNVQMVYGGVVVSVSSAPTKRFMSVSVIKQ
ncbi:MAG TPA: hypothetical protein VLA61_16475 [Ideonella sp.]|uniref:hypothetical protein n=1 Tax=Ideonella sp. TaxID=1929293 RepID=UPI002CEB94E3|nr:hypothetical protein [Ideonella sp.]HSI49869.1 hypothetical protein [Ideonella sp.]